MYSVAAVGYYWPLKSVLVDKKLINSTTNGHGLFFFGIGGIYTRRAARVEIDKNEVTVHDVVVAGGLLWLVHHPFTLFTRITGGVDGIEGRVNHAALGVVLSDYFKDFLHVFEITTKGLPVSEYTNLNRAGKLAGTVFVVPLKKIKILKERLLLFWCQILSHFVLDLSSSNSFGRCFISE